MSDRPESPLLDEHDHLMEESHDGHHHDHALDVIEEPLDPASQSLSDALRASFRVLKAIMLVVVVLFLLSGVYRVDKNEKVVVSHLGKLQPPSLPGLHMAWPYPVDERTSVFVGDQNLSIDSFWYTLADADKNKQPTELPSRGQSLDPATDGALLTGDHAIMNLGLVVRYRIQDVESYVKNVSNADQLLKSVFQDAAIAEAARTRADDLSKSASEVAQRIRKRAQDALDEMKSGINILFVAADRSYYPLQTKDAVQQVSERENSKNEAIQGAIGEQQKKLNGVAGKAWQPIYEQIQKLDQEKDAAKHEAILQEIDRLLLSDETGGEASGKIKQAQAQKNKIIADAQTRVAQFEALLKGHREHPELLRQQLRQRTLADLFDQDGISKWLLPAGDKQVNLVFNQDPVQIREKERAEMTKKADANK